MEPENPWAWQQIGLNYKELEDYKSAVEAFDNALDMDPNFILGLLEKGVTLGLIKQYTEALECFHEVLIKDPENPDALHFKEITLEYMNQEEKVVK